MSFIGKLKRILAGKPAVDAAQFKRQFQPPAKEPDLKLYVGRSTGELSARGHASGLYPNQDVYLTDDGLCQNICVMGGIGAGKTTRVINPLLWQTLSHAEVGGLIFDIKGDFGETVQSFANYWQRPVVKIGVGKGVKGINLLKGLTPEQAAGFLQSAFYLTGGVTNDSFWIQSATALIQNTLGLLEALGPHYYTLEKCYQYIFFEDARKALNILLDDVHFEPGSLQERQLKNYKGYYNNVFMMMDVKTRESIKGTLATILSPFQQPELVDAFSGSDNDYELMHILDGDVVLVDLPLSRWQTAGKVVYTMIKLRFFNILQTRQVDKTLPQNYVFFFCDEYQNVISASKEGLSDLSFWDKSRSSKCFGIISTQSISSFRSAIGNQQITDTILANFRQKIFFRTEDVETLNYINQLAGQVEVVRNNYNSSTSTNQSVNNPWSTLIFGGDSWSTSSNVGTQTIEHKLVDANLVRQLTGNLVLAFLSVDGESADDVLIVTPLYPDTPDGINRQLGVA